MSAALLYRPNTQWQTSVAFVGAIVLHVAAISLAANRTSVNQLATTAPGLITVIEYQESADQPLPAEPEEALPAPPAPPAIDDAFVEESVPPPPMRKTERRSEPIRRRTTSTAAGLANTSAARVFAISAPRPEYPYEARRQRLTGSGVAVLTVDARGYVSDVTMLRSTGSGILDQATVNGFRRWKFKPGTASRVETPITYTFAGAGY